MSDYERFTELSEAARREGVTVDVDSDNMGHTVTVDRDGYFGKGRDTYYKSSALRLAMQDLEQTEREHGVRHHE